MLIHIYELLVHSFIFNTRISAEYPPGPPKLMNYYNRKVENTTEMTIILKEDRAAF